MGKNGLNRDFMGAYEGDNLDRVAFPMGGMGGGMVCLEGTGAFSHVSVRSKPEVYNEPAIFAALCVKSPKGNIARVLEGQVPQWKVFGAPASANGSNGKTHGLPRFSKCSFSFRFPFATVSLSDPAVPVLAEVTGWSPFFPGETDHASMPVAAVEYKLKNRSKGKVEGVFSFHSANFMKAGKGAHGVQSVPGGFVLHQEGTKEEPHTQGDFAVFALDQNVKVNHVWFRGGWFDGLSKAWLSVEKGEMPAVSPAPKSKPSGGGSLYVPFSLNAGAEKTIRVCMAWYAPYSTVRIGGEIKKYTDKESKNLPRYQPWYSERFNGVNAVAKYWREHCEILRKKSATFSSAFYDTTLPSEVVEAVSANLTILKSPTSLRQRDGRFWGWEGCCDGHGCCAGSCTHVWNYAQAMPHPFPDMERSLRETEFNVCQDDRGHQNFRSPLPIRTPTHGHHAAADGQPGGIMKIYREWRISGDTAWLKAIWPRVKKSMDYCISTWDPRERGILEEPHHNTYDIEFWGPDGMCGSVYLGALKAAVRIAEALGEKVPRYEKLYERGRKYLETSLFNGEYFYQKIMWKGLKAANPEKAKNLPSEYLALMKKEGPKYQYGKGCLSDGVIGAWMGKTYGLGDILDQAKVKSHLRAVYRYNLKRDLTLHTNPQRPSYALNSDGGLLLCSWPKGGRLSLPFVYSDEVWTGIEYQVAAHMIMEGCVKEGLDIVREVRKRYDGHYRNPFNEYECGHWYARAMASYALIQSLSGARYDAVERVLYLEPRVKGDFRSFIATQTGFGTVGVRKGKPFVDVVYGTIPYGHIKYRPA